MSDLNYMPQVHTFLLEQAQSIKQAELQMNLMICVQTTTTRLIHIIFFLQQTPILFCDSLNHGILITQI